MSEKVFQLRLKIFPIKIFNEPRPLISTGPEDSVIKGEMY